MRHIGIAGAIALFMGLGAAAACSGSKDDDPRNGKDGYSGGSQPLVLNPAPPGLCDGDGSEKDCSTPGGCKGSGGSGGGPLGGGGSGGGAAYGGGSGYGGYGTGGGTGGGINLGGSAGAGAAGGSVATGGAGGAGGSVATGGAGGVGGTGAVGTGAASGDAGCVIEPDSGKSSCNDAGAETGDAGPGQSQDITRPQASSSCNGLQNTKPATIYESADDSNSTASPVIARRLIRSGQKVPLSVLRTWEFLSYYDFSFEPAQAGEVRIVPQLSSCPKGNELSLQVALQAEHRSADQRRALNLTFVLDTSGSMGGYGGQTAPIDLERAAVLEIAGQLRAGDIVSVVTWDTSQSSLLSGHVISGPNDAKLVDIAQDLVAGGGTDLHSGLVSGYALAEKNYSKDKINRVILISDGIANVGITDEELIGKYADDEESDEGIYLAGIGVGDGVNDTLMNVVTDVGRGAYVYLDSEEEAHKMLGDRFLSVVDLAARAVRLEVSLPWYMQVQRFYGEQISTDPVKVRPQHLGPNDAMLFFQVLSACDRSLIHGDDRIRLRATWETPFGHQPREAVVDTTFNALAGDDADLTKAAAITSYAEALSYVAVLTKPDEQKTRLQVALGNVQAAKGAGTDPDLVEISELIQSYIANLGYSGS